jgi:hypothetical protein
MALDLSKLKSRLNSLSNTNNKTQLIWKPKPGKQVVRIVPYKYQPDNPFIELKFHYNINNKTYLSPDSFNRPDPIVEWSNRMKKTGNKEDWQLGRKMEPKMRTYAPILVRGEESEGIKFWGFGKNVYQEILSIINDPDYGDITDPVNGRDIVVEFRTAEDSGKSFPETTIRVKPNATIAIDVSQKDILAQQVNILDLFPEYSYDELKSVMDAWLNPETQPTEGTVNTIVEDDAPFTTSPTPSPSAGKTATASPSAKSSKANTDDVTAAFDNLFNS